MNVLGEGNRNGNERVVNPVGHTEVHITTILSLFEVCERVGIKLWLESGWAIDARLGVVTRAHDDIDIAYPVEQDSLFRRVLTEEGFSDFQAMDYGFLMRRDEILIDCEPCHKRRGEYALSGLPEGSCPDEKQGRLNGEPVRCISWEAMYFEFLGYEQEIPRASWRSKDHLSLRIIEEHLNPLQLKKVKKLFLNLSKHPK